MHFQNMLHWNTCAITYIPDIGNMSAGLEFSKIFYLQIFASDQMFNWQYEVVNWHFHDHVSYYYYYYYTQWQCIWTSGMTNDNKLECLLNIRNIFITGKHKCLLRTFIIFSIFCTWLHQQPENSEVLIYLK
jgi:hypothetical protein